jgi:hypothetical protein
VLHDGKRVSTFELNVMRIAGVVDDMALQVSGWRPSVTKNHRWQGLNR